MKLMLALLLLRSYTQIEQLIGAWTGTTTDILVELLPTIVADTFPNNTADILDNVVPMMVSGVRCTPLVGVMDVIIGLATSLWKGKDVLFPN